MFKFLIVVLGLTVFSFSEVKVIDNSSPVQVKLGKKLFNSKSKYTSKPLIKCLPELENVVFRVDSKSSISIIPEKNLPSSTTYNCRVGKNGPIFIFETKPFSLTDVVLFHREKLIRLNFNDSVEIDSLKEHLIIYKRNALSKTELQYKILSYGGKSILIEILEPLGKDGVDIVIKKGFKSVGGAITEKDIDKSVSIVNGSSTKLNSKFKRMRIFDKPQMILYRGNYLLRLFFDDYFDSVYDIKPFIQIDGVENFKVKKTDYLSEKDKKYLNFKVSGNSYVYVDISSPEFKPNREYKITLKKGLKHYKQLKEDITFKVETGNLLSFIQFPESDKVYLSTLGDIGFESVNVSKATLRVNKITPENYRYFILYANRDSSKVKKFVEEIFSRDLSLNSPKNERIKQRFHISELAKEGSGVYEIVLNYQVKDASGEIRDAKASKVVFVSDIGISAKMGKEQLFISLFSLKSADPIKKGKIEIFSEKNILIKTQEVSSDGTATINIKKLLSKKPKAIIVSTEDDKNFLLLDKGISKTLSIKNIEKRLSKYRAYIYFQSDIVRPGMDIHSLVVVKDGDLNSLENVPIKVKLVRSRDTNTVFNKVYKTDSNGAIDLNISIPYYERSGAYFLSLYFGKELIGKKRVDIESFQPPQIKNSVTATKACIGVGFIDVNISSNYLFGAPASNLTGTVSLKGVEGEYTNSLFKDYNFSSRSESSKKRSDYLIVEESSNISLDSEGRSSFRFPCRLTNSSDATTVDGVVGATVMDGVQPVSAYKSVKIFPYSKVVGIKLSQKIVDVDKSVDGWAVLVDPLKGKSVDSDMIVKVSQINWFYTYSSGNYRWESQKREIDSFRIKSEERFSYKAPKEGSYEIKVIDPLTGAYAVQSFEVSGWWYSTPSYRTDPRGVSIDFEPKEYKRGEILKASIKSPIVDGKLLLTVESDRVVWHKLYTIKKGSASVNIPLDFDLGRGVYLGALVVRETDSNSSIVPFRAFGFKPVRVNRRDKEIKVSLDFNKTLKSNSKVDLEISTDREAEILVSVVDVGILNITVQTPPNPFKFFTPIPEFSMAMFDIYDSVMGYIAEGKLISFGAGDEEVFMSRKKHLPPPDTKRVKPFMLWSGLFHTKDRKSSFRIEIPDFNGRARVSVVAVANNSVGAKSDEFVVKDEIILKPSMPLFLLTGDKLKLPMKIFNTTDRESDIRLKINSSENLKISTKNSLSFTLKPKEQREIWLDVKPLKEGKAFVKFSTNGYKKEIEIPIYSPFTLTDYVRKGLIPTATSKEIYVPEKFRGGRVILTLSDNVLGELKGDLKYLLSYPYGCAEQTASKIGVLSWSKDFFRDESLQGRAKLFIREGERKLSRMVNYGGEINYWLNGNYVEPYSSIYASDVLLELNSTILSKEHRDSIIEALNSIASLNSTALEASYNSLLKCYSAYILAREKEVRANTLNMLYEKGVCESSEIGKLFLASAYKELGENKLMKRIYERVNLSLEEIANSREQGYPFGGWKWKLFTTAYLKARYFGLSDSNFALVRSQFNTLFSTHEKALAIRTVVAHLGKPSSKPMSVEMRVNSKSKLYKSPVTFITDLNRTEISIKVKEGEVSYSVDAYKYLPRPIKNGIDQSSNFGVSRRFLSKDGEVLRLDNLRVKDEIYAEITILNRPRVDNLIIDMRIPSCMEIINSRIEKFKGKFSNHNIEFNYKDIRDDRILLSTSLREKKETYKLSNSGSMVRLKPNIHKFYVPLRVTALGECKLPSMVVESMYDERFRDYVREGDRVVVRKEALEMASKPSQKERLKSFIKKYYSLEEKSAPPSSFRPFFDFPIKNFFGKRAFSYKSLMKNRDRYNRDWPKKRYQIDSITIKKLSSNRFNVEVEFSYKLQRGNKIVEGISRQYLEVVSQVSGFKIEAIDIIK